MSLKLDSRVAYQLSTDLQALDNKYFSHLLFYYEKLKFVLPFEEIEKQIAKIKTAQEKHIEIFAKLFLNDPDNLHEMDTWITRYNNETVHKFKLHKNHKGFRNEITDKEMLEAIAEDFTQYVIADSKLKFRTPQDREYVLDGMSKELVEMFLKHFDNADVIKNTFEKCYDEAVKEIEVYIGTSEFDKKVFK